MADGHNRKDGMNAQIARTPKQLTDAVGAAEQHAKVRDLALNHGSKELIGEGDTGILYKECSAFRKKGLQACT